MSATETETIRWEQGADGVVVLTLDDPEHSTNTMNDAYTRSMEATVERLEAEREQITGVIVTSAKKTFFAGGDLNQLAQVTPEHADAAMDRLTRSKAQLRRLEQLGRPVVAALNGSALGGGLEIALACHHRIAVDTSAARFGFPEVTLGLLPGAGGVTRTVRMLGVLDALLKLLAQGQQLRPGKALETGVLDELADGPEQMMDRAREWIAATAREDGPEPSQPWDRPGHRIPGGTPASPKFAADLPGVPANLAKQLNGAPYPAPRAVLCAAVEGAQVDFDTALTVESRWFVHLATGQISKNMINALFFDMRHISSGGSRPEGHPARKANKVAVLGAGMMGSGIAHACADAGMRVVLRDVDTEAAERGRDRCAEVFDKAVKRGRMTQADRDAAVDRIQPTAKATDLAGCDLVIEAVFEDPELKARVFADVEDAVQSDALLCSNTSTLPITDLSHAVARQSDFVGLHFFSPVHRMKLVEVIRGQNTSDEALARALDVVQQIRKVPIVVNDSRGFFTSRVIGTYLDEGLALLAEGTPPASVEQASLQAGYPAGVLQLMDELTLTLMRSIRRETEDARQQAGVAGTAASGGEVLNRMVEEFDRKGRSAGAGFYTYDAEGQRQGLWSGLAEHWGSAGGGVAFVDAQQRMLFAEALETVRCVEEGVIEHSADANVGSILGIGYPAWTGGVLRYINQFDGGPAGFARRARELAEQYGERFIPPQLLEDKAARAELF